MKKHANTAAAALAALALSLPFAACSGSDDDPDPKPGPGGPAVVYVAGYVGNPDTGAARAAYWKDGALQQLNSNNTPSRANSICVSGGNVYVAGNVGSAGKYNAENRATVWTNGSPRQLSDIRSIAHSVYASGNTVYVAGGEWDSAVGDWAAMIWSSSNGGQWSKQRLGSNRAVADSVHVSGGTVYAGGSEVMQGQTYQPATIWTGGSARHIDDQRRYGFANSVHVSGGTVYAAGWFSPTNAYADDRAFYWYSDDGGTLQRLSDDSSNACSVHVSGDYICIAGWHNTSGYAGGDRAVLWRNKGNSLELSAIPSEARSVYISGDTVYVAGWENVSQSGDATGLRATLWKDGTRQPYLTGGETVSAAHSVFVVQ
jgi:hypothetical protein